MTSAQGPVAHWPVVDGAVSAAAALGFQPRDPAFIADPYPALAGLRERHRILYDERTSQSNLQLVEPPAWKPTYVLRGLAALRVRA